MNRPASALLILLHSAKPSGAELALVRRLPHMRHLNPLVILAEDGEIPSLLRAHGIAHQVVNVKSHHGAHQNGKNLRAVTNWIAYANVVDQALRDQPLSGVWSHSLKTAIVARRISHRRNIPWIWDVHDRLSRDYLPAIVAYLARLLIRHLPDAVVVNSAATLESIGRARRPVLISPPGLRERTYELVDYHQREIDILVPGRLAPWKGQDLVLEALGQLAATYPHLRVVFMGGALFGEDEFESLLRSRSSELHLDSIVTFAGHCSHPWQYMVNSRVVIHGSRIPEPFGSVVTEAMQAGCVVIAPRAGGPSEIITDTVSGLLYEPGSTDDLAQSIAKVLSGGVEHHRMSESAQIRAQDFALIRLMPVVLPWFESILSRRRPPDPFTRTFEEAVND